MPFAQSHKRSSLPGLPVGGRFGLRLFVVDECFAGVEIAIVALQPRRLPLPVLAALQQPLLLASLRSPPVRQAAGSFQAVLEVAVGTGRDAVW